MEIPTIVTETLNRLMAPLLSAKAEQQHSLDDDLRQMIMAIAEGRAAPDSHSVFLLDRARRDGIDVEATAARYLERKKWAKDASELSAREKALEAAERERSESKSAENLRREAADRQEADRDEDCRRKLADRDQSLEGKGNLIADGALSTEYFELSRELQEIKKEQDELARRLNPIGDQDTVPLIVPVWINPPRSCEKRSPSSPTQKDRRATILSITRKLKNRVAMCKRAIGEAEAKKKTLDKREDQINRKLAAIDDRHKPESFRLIKKSETLSLDDKMKQLANERGWGATASV